MRLAGWLLVFAAIFALGFSVRVVSASTSQDTGISGLSGVFLSLIALAVGAFLVVRTQPR